MGKVKYIYGASIQGIQSFIFQTNELKDIVGGSELVENICTSLFLDNYRQQGQPLVNAAGNIKCIYDDIAECQKTVLEFPKAVMSKAPGITISQAVVKADEDELKTHFKQLMDTLESKLRIQRNKPAKSMTIGFMGVERSRKTGLPAICNEGNDFIDEGTLQKRRLSVGGEATRKLCEKSFGQNDLSVRNIALNIKDLTDKNDWIAIIHADGNGLGQVVAKVGGDEEGLRNFSKKLDEATEQAAHAAFKKVYTDTEYTQNSIIFPFRPVVLGGDDMTMICKASLALDYAKNYLEEFEKATKQKFGADNGLTACAGIAFIKSSYPFHYGYDLAEELCSQAKKISKSDFIQKDEKCAPSSIMFYKVQGSFIESYEDMLRKEKTPQEGHSFNFGPYFIHPTNTDEYLTVKDLEDNVAVLQGKEGNTAKTDIRKWMSAMHQDIEMAKQAASRSRFILSSEKLKHAFDKATTGIKRTLSKGEILYYPAADLLDLNTILNQTTKED